MSSTTVDRATDLTFDVEKYRADFPILKTLARGKPLVYLDNAATSQKPQQVIDRISHYYAAENANVHRGVHFLSELATSHYEAVREKARRFLNARSQKEVIFVRGCTEGINLVASTYGRRNIGAGDEIVVSGIEHHSNIVPWQMLCEDKGAVLRVIPANDRGEIELGAFDAALTDRTKLVAIVHVSNALGTINPIKEMTARAHARGIPILVDGAQAAPHIAIDVQDLDCDFYTISGHKMFAPTGIGILYGKEKLLEAMPPWQGGGDMILSVTFEKTTYNALPYKFEAGTPNIADTIALGAAIDYMTGIGIDRIAAYEHELVEYATAQLSKIDRLRIIGTARQKASVISFVLEGVHPHDIGTIIDQEGVAIRTGHHCAQPVMMHFKVPATARASFAFYNTREEVDRLVAGIHKVLEVFG
ncbi:MAG TPA: cysteine desulfurase [Thermoanaerobaculia bacterium]|nr:cysteine desulfurase [Thermoanaerobaculia bacterium]